MTKPKQQQFLLGDSFNDVDPDGKPKKRGGPPNRMNDLVYRDWMKFQKSFFRFETFENYVQLNIEFFTKKVWPDGRPSSVLISGFPKFDQGVHGAGRAIRHHPAAKSVQEVVDVLVSNPEVFDFIFVDLSGNSELFAELAGNPKIFDELFSVLRGSLRDDRYCGVIMDSVENDSEFPIPWALSAQARKHLRLRDEKIGIRDSGTNLHCMYLQSADDLFRSYPFTPGEVSVVSTDVPIPHWLIPKPPPRRPNEILHPAKYPETLVQQFIDLFCPENGVVLDPMVGTGSSLVAALRTGRSGTGVELSNEFADIARQRLAAEPTMFTEGAASVISGDALKVVDIVDDAKFDYCITSPPYWSMLQNKGSEYQRGRRDKQLKTVYSDDRRDLGNIGDYDQFMEMLKDVYTGVHDVMKTGAYLTVVIKNVKRNHTVYAAAWDLVSLLSGRDGQFEYVGNTLWCQDDVGMKPFAVGTHWVSNTVHTYCLHFRKG